MAGPFAPALRTLERGNRPEPPLGFFIVAGHRGDCHLAAEPLPVPVRLLLPADSLLVAGRVSRWRFARRAERGQDLAVLLFGSGAWRHKGARRGSAGPPGRAGPSGPSWRINSGCVVWIDLAGVSSDADTKRWGCHGGHREHANI